MLTVGDLLERERHQRCPRCDRRAALSADPDAGAWYWTCPDCPASGLGYPSRDAAFAALKRRRRGRGA